MTDQTPIPAATGIPVPSSNEPSSNGIINAGYKSPGATLTNEQYQNSGIMKAGKDTPNLASQPHIDLGETEVGAQARNRTQLEQAMAYSTAKRGFTLDKDGNQTSTANLDNASWWDGVLENGLGYDTHKLIRETTGAGTGIDGSKDSSGQSSTQHGRTFAEQALSFIPGADQILGNGYTQKSYKPYVDPKTGEIWAKEFDGKDARDYHSVASAYGPRSVDKNFGKTFFEGLGNMVGSFPSDIVSLAQMGKDLVDPDQSSALDRLANHMEKQNVLNRASEYDNNGSFSSMAGFSGFIGSNMSMLFGFSEMAKGASWAAKASTLFKSPEAIDMAGRLGAAFMLSAGGAFKEAKESGLDGRDAAMMALTTGMVDSMIQEKIGVHNLSKFLMKGGSTAINKMVLAEGEKLGINFTKKALDDASPSIMAKAWDIVKSFDKLTDVPIAGPALEQFAVMGGQSMVNSTGQMLYNHMSEGDPKKKEGDGLYHHISKEEFFNKAWSEAASAAVVGGLMGIPVAFSGKDEQKSIIPYIQKGETDRIYKAIDWYRSDGQITVDQATALTERVGHLDNIYNKNKKVYESIGDPIRRAAVVTSAVGHIDMELKYKEELKVEQEKLAKVIKDNGEPGISPTVAQTAIDAQQKNVDIKQEQIKNVQGLIREHLPDTDGKIPMYEKIKITDELTKHFIDKHLETTSENKPYAKSFATSTFNKSKDGFKSMVESIYKDKGSVVGDEEKSALDALVSKELPTVKEDWLDHHTKAKKAAEDLNKSLKDNIEMGNYSNVNLATMLRNDKLTPLNRQVIIEEVKRRADIERKASGEAKSYDPTSDVNKASVALFGTQLDNNINIINEGRYPTTSLKNILRHSELADKHRKTIEQELVRRAQLPLAEKIVPVTKAPVRETDKEAAARRTAEETKRKAELAARKGVPPITEAPVSEGEPWYRDHTSVPDTVFEDREGISTPIYHNDLVHYLGPEGEALAGRVSHIDDTNKIVSILTPEGLEHQVDFGNITSVIDPSEAMNFSEMGMDMQENMDEIINAPEEVKMLKFAKWFKEGNVANTEANLDFVISNMENIRKYLATMDILQESNTGNVDFINLLLAKEIPDIKFSAHTVSFLSILYTVLPNRIKVSKIDRETGLLMRNPNKTNRKIESDMYYNEGTRIHIMEATYEELKEHGLTGEDESKYSRTQYAEDMKNGFHNHLVIKATENVLDKKGKVVTPAGEILGFYPQDHRKFVNHNVDSKSYLQMMEVKRIMAEHHGDEEPMIFHSSITKKTAGHINLNRTLQPIFTALGNGKKLANRVVIGIRIGGQNRTGKEVLNRLTNGKLKEGQVFAALPRSDGSTTAVPLSVSQVGKAKALTIFKIIEAQYSKRTNAGKALNKSFSDVEKSKNLSQYKNLMSYLEGIVYRRSVDRETNPASKNVFDITGDTIAERKIIFGHDPSDQYLLQDIFNDPKIQKEVINKISLLYNAVDKNKINTYEPHQEIVYKKDGNFSFKKHDSYGDYLNTILKTNVQGFPVEEGSIDHTFTSQPIIELAPPTPHPRIAQKEVAKEAVQLTGKGDDSVSDSDLAANNAKPSIETMIDDSNLPLQAPAEAPAKVKRSAPSFTRDRSSTKDENQPKPVSSEEKPLLNMGKFVASENPDEKDDETNINIKDALFVNTDDYDITDQNTVVKTVAAELYRQSLYNNVVNEVRASTKDFFQEYLDWMNEEPEDSGIMIGHYETMMANWDRIEEKALELLGKKGIDFKTAKEIGLVQEVPNEGELENPEHTEAEIHSQDANNTANSWDEGTIFSQSALNKASAQIRSILEFIPVSEYLPGAAVSSEKINKYGRSEFHNSGDVWVALLNATQDILPTNIHGELLKLASKNAMFDQVLKTIKDHQDEDGNPDQAILNQFLMLLSLQEAKFITVKMKTDEMGNNSLDVFETNRQKVDNIVMDKWSEDMKNNGKLVKENEQGFKYIDTVEGWRIASQYTEELAKIDLTIHPNKGLLLLQSTFKDIGIVLSRNFLQHLKDNKIRINGNDVELSVLLHNFIPRVLNSLSGMNNESDVPDSSIFENNNPFATEKTTLKALAQVEGASNLHIYEDSFIGGDGHSRYSHVANSYLSHLFKLLGTEDPDNEDSKVKQLLSIPYSRRSMWLNNFINMKTSFGLQYFDSLGAYNKVGKNKMIKDMSPKEKELTRVSLFQNAGNEMSRYLIPVPGDKTLWPMITAMRIEIGLDARPENKNQRLIPTDSNGMFHLYNIVLSEHERIYSVNQANLKASIARDEHAALVKEATKNNTAQPPALEYDGLIEGYHYNTAKDGSKVPGMGTMHITFPELNDPKRFEKMYDDQGKLNEEYVKTYLQDFFNKEIKRTERDWVKMGLVKKEEGMANFSVLLDRNYNKNRTENKITQLAADYTVNQFLFNFNYTQVIGGDPALAGKKNITETLKNYGKRMVKDMAPGLDPMFTKPTFTTIFLKDIEGAALFQKTYAKFLEKTIGREKAQEAYSNIQISNAQEYTTLDEHYAVMVAQGKGSPALAQAVERLKAGGIDPTDINSIMGPMKPVYVGDKYDPEMGIYRKYYIKTSAFPLIPSLIRNTPLDALRVHMEKNGIDRAVYESGVKMGLESSSTPMSVKGSLDMTPDFGISKIHTLDRSGFRIQQELPYHGHERVNEGTQVRKQLYSNSEPDQEIFSMGRKTTAKQAYTQFEELHSKRIELAWKRMSKEFGITSKEDDDSIQYGIKDVKAFQTMLVQEAKSRNYPINDLAGLSMVINSKTGEGSFKIPLSFNNSSNKFEAIINSIFTNRIIKQDLPGGAYTEGSNAGLHVSGKLSEDLSNDVTYIDPADRGKPLGFFKPTEDGKNGYADILVPPFIKVDGKLVDLRKLDMSKIDQEVLQMFGYRIPTQGLNSMMIFRVKGFLPAYVGDLVIVPGELTEQMGSDFDADKLYLHTYHHEKDSTGRYRKVAALNESQLANMDKLQETEGPKSKRDNEILNKRIENSIVQHYMDRLEFADEKTIAQILAPSGYGNLEQLNDDIQAIKKKEPSNYFLPRTQNDIHKINADGVAGKGIFSLYSSFLQLAQMNGLTLKNQVRFVIKGNTWKKNTFTVKNNHGEGGLAADTIFYLQSASVDNAKYQFLSGLNINTKTMNVAGLIAATGYDEAHIAYFLSQPSIVEFVEAEINQYSIADRGHSGINPLIDTITHHTKDNKNYGPDFMQKVIDGTAYASRAYSLEDMKEEITNPTPTGQIDLLLQFMQLRRSAEAVDKVIKATNINTKGIGTTYADLEASMISINNVIMDPDPMVKGVVSLFKGNSIIATTSRYAERMYHALGEFFPYSNTGYSEMKDRIKQYSNGESLTTAAELKALYNHAKSFILSNTNLIDGEDMADMRNRLYYDTKDNVSLGSRIVAMRKADPTNQLLQRLEVDNGKRKGDSVTISINNIPSNTKSDNVDLSLQYFYKMRDEELKADPPEAHPLTEDLIKYFLMTGGTFNPRSLSRIIPLDLMEAHGFSGKLRSVMQESMNDQSFFNNFYTQYFQHNPVDAYQIKESDVNPAGAKTMMPGKTILFNGPDRMIITAGNTTYFDEVHQGVNGQEYAGLPVYLSRLDPNSNQYSLYVLSEVREGRRDHIYTRVPVYSEPNMSFYDFNRKTNSVKSDEIAVAGKVENNGTGGNSIYGKEPDKSPQPVESEQLPVKAKKVVKAVKVEGPKTFEDLRDALGMNEVETHTSAKDVLQTIMDDENTTQDIKHLAADLHAVLDDTTTIKHSDKLEAAGWYTKGSDSVNLNLNSLLRYGNPLVEAKETLIHELLHRVLVEKMRSPEELEGSQRQAYDRIKSMFDKYVEEARKKDPENFSEFLRVTKKNFDHVMDPKNNPNFTEKEGRFFNDHVEQYYPLTDMDEFAVSLSSNAFSETLKKNNHWKSLFGSLMDFLGFNYKNDWEALFDSVNQINKHESDYQFGKNTHDRFGKKIKKSSGPKKKTADPMQGDMFQSPETPEAAPENLPEGKWDGKEDPNYDPFKGVNFGGDEGIGVSLKTGKKLDSTKIAKEKILDRYHADEEGIVPKSTFLPDLMRDVDLYNSLQGYDALVLMKNGEDISIKEEKNVEVATLLSMKKVQRKSTDLVHGHTVDSFVKQLENNINRLQKRRKATENTNIIDSQIGHNRAQIYRLMNTERMSEIVDIAADHLTHAFKKVNTQLLSMDELNQIENISTIFSNLDSTFHFKDNEYNQKVKQIIATNKTIQLKVDEQKYQRLVEYMEQNPNIPDSVDYDSILKGPQMDTNWWESNMLSSDRSSSKFVRLAGELIKHSNENITTAFNHWEHGVMGLFNEYLKNNKNYMPLVQLDKHGEPTGYMLHEYNYEYCQAEQAASQDRKTYWAFIRDNNEFTLSSEGKAMYIRDLDWVKQNNKNWQIPNTIDASRVESFIRTHDPEGYMKNVSMGLSPTQTLAYNYISKEPKVIHRDPRFDDFMAKGEDHNDVKLFNMIRDEFKNNGRKYGNKDGLNNIPEISKSLIGYLGKGNFKGAFTALKGGFLNSTTSRIDKITKDAVIDPVTGKPYDTIPIYYFDNMFKASDKTYDLKRVIFKMKQQDIAVQEKMNVEPYLNYMQRMLFEADGYVKNNTGGIAQAYDASGVAQNVILKGNSNANALSQLDFILSDFLYNKGVKHTELIGAPKAGETDQLHQNAFTGLDENEHWEGPPEPGKQYVTISKMTDSLNVLTRSLGLIVNVPAALNNLTFGIISNLTYGTGNKEYSTNDSFAAFGHILWAMAPGTEGYKKIKLFSEMFNVENKINELRFDKIPGRDVENPFSNVNPYFMSQKGEYFIQNHLAIAMALAHKVGDTNLWDGYKVEGDKLVWKPEDNNLANPMASETSSREFARSIKSTIFKNHGNYEQPVQFKKEWYGRLLMTFKTWVPEMVNAKWGGEKEGLDGTKEIGRYLSIGHLLSGPDGVKSAKNALTNLFTIYSKDPTLSHMSELDRTNIRRSIADVLFTVGLLTAALAVKSGMQGDKDKNEKARMIFLMNMLMRNYQDMSFLFNPGSVVQLFKSPIPAINTLSNIFDLFPQAVSSLMGHDSYTNGTHKGSKFLHKLIKVVPYANFEQKIEATATQYNN